MSCKQADTFTVPKQFACGCVLAWHDQGEQYVHLGSCAEHEAQFPRGTR